MINVMGTSTSVSASDSAQGWYIAALNCLSTIGRWLNRAGISAMVVSAEKRIELGETEKVSKEPGWNDAKGGRTRRAHRRANKMSPWYR